jgi:curved DNA-binding protein CbpA
MAGLDTSPQRTLYSLLQIHPAAPLDLISAAYWRLAAQAHAARTTDESAERRLAELTHAYRVLSDPARRSQYDHSFALAEQPVAPNLRRRRKQTLFQRILRRSPRQSDLDYYDLLRVDPAASASIIHEAYPIIRGFYLRFVRLGKEPPELLDLLEEAYAVTSDPVRRARYEQDRAHWQRPSTGDGRQDTADRRQQSGATPPPSGGGVTPHR